MFGEEVMTKEKAPLDQCCDQCGKDTRMGTGLFVNRLASDVGFICPECSKMPCDRCEEDIYLDYDIVPEDLGLDAFKDNAWNVHYECLSGKEKKLFDRKQNNG